MESASLEGVCERLREEVAAELVTGPGKRWRCPAGLKSRIVSYARVCRERGEPLLDISDRYDRYHVSQSHILPVFKRECHNVIRGTYAHENA